MSTQNKTGRKFIMPIQKARLHRLMRIASLLKENRYPNSESLVKEFRRMAVEEELEVDCVKKTVLRDLHILKTEFKCPLDFDRARNGYYLKHHGWDFISPALLDENEILAAVIGGRISESIFPPPLRNRIRNAVDYLLQNNNPDFLDTANMDSLSILSGLYADLNPGVFLAMFEGWQDHKCVRIHYVDYAGKVTERIFEPHTMVFYENNWYSKGFCRLKQAPRTFAIQRIRQAELLNGHFTPDKDIIRSVNPDDFLGFRKIGPVRIRISPYMRERLNAQPLHTGQTFSDDGTVEIPAVTKERLFPFLLSAGKDAELLSPADLREEMKSLLKDMLSAYK